MSALRLLLLTGLFLGGLRNLPAGEQIVRHTYSDVPDTFVQIESVFGSASNHGAMPFHVTIRNNSGSARTWQIRAKEGENYRQLSMLTTAVIPVPDGSEVTQVLILPFAPSFLSYNYRNLEFQVSASGLPGEVFRHTETLPESFPILAMSSALARQSLLDLNRDVAAKNSNNPYFAKEFEAEDLPTDWIAYSGLDALLMDADLWGTVTSAQRQAMIAWVRLGGRLDLYGAGAFDASLPDLPGNLVAGTVSGMGSGRVGLFEWSGDKLPTSTLSRYESLFSMSESLDRDYESGWDLYRLLEPGNFQPLFIFLVLLAFAILVAPVNLFVLARAGRRHRLFITTPLISLATCAALFVMIFFIDGIGGTGHRVVLAEIQGGGENHTYIVQEQVSRTGVMLNSGFSPDQELRIDPVHLPESRLNPFSNNGGRGTQLRVADGGFSGPWFRSRSEQGYLVRAAVPSRARIEFCGTEDGIPILISNLPETISRFAFVDSQGQWWDLTDGGRVASGHRLPLVKREERASVMWIESFRKKLSKTRRANFPADKGTLNRFYAEVETPNAYALQTHPSIRWQTTDLLLTGNPVPANPTRP